MVPDNILPLAIYEEVPGAPYHDFWLRSTTEHVMGDYMSVVAKEAPVRLSDLVSIRKSERSGQSDVAD